MSLNALIERGLGAWNARDPEAIAADFAVDSTYWSPTLVDVDAPGPASVRADATMLFTAFPDFTLVERGRVVSQEEGRASLWWELSATFAGPLDPPGFSPTNGPITNHGVAWVEQRNGRIARFHL